MINLILILYAGSLFAIVFLVAPVLLRVDIGKELAGRLYGKILWRFYKLSALGLLVYSLLGNVVLGFLLLAGLIVSMFISRKVKETKKRLGNIEAIPYFSPERVRFRKLSYLSLTSLFLNFLLSIAILLKEVS